MISILWALGAWNGLVVSAGHVCTPPQVQVVKQSQAIRQSRINSLGRLYSHSGLEDGHYAGRYRYRSIAACTAVGTVVIRERRETEALAAKARFEISCRLTPVVSSLHFKPTMSSNFGTGQGLFTTSNQNKNPATSTPGSAPAAGASPFANLGANTTNSSVFGGSGAGAGNTPAGGGTTGSIFGTGGSAFGSSGNTNMAMPAAAGAGTGAGTTTPFGSAFAGLYASYSVFINHLIQRIT